MRNGKICHLLGMINKIYNSPCWQILIILTAGYAINSLNYNSDLNKDAATQ
jgi:hypothetical protein